MVNIQIVTLSLIIAAVLIILGYIKGKNYLYMALSGGVILLFVGIISWGNPIDFQTGTNTSCIALNDSACAAIGSDPGCTTTIENFTYDSLDGNLGFIISGVLTLFGLFIIIMSVVSIYGSRYENFDKD